MTNIEHLMDEAIPPITDAQLAAVRRAIAREADAVLLGRILGITPDGQAH